jgi:nucleoside diphosphate kinase
VDRTLVIVKPDGVERGLVGEIIARLERKGLSLVAAELREVTREVASVHYAEHEGKAFYDDLVVFITRSPAMVMVVEGPQDTYKPVRRHRGPSGATWRWSSPRTWSTGRTRRSPPPARSRCSFPNWV